MTKCELSGIIIFVVQEKFGATNAEVAELADAHGSGPCGSNTLWVRLPSSAGRKQEFPVWRFLFLCSFFCSRPARHQTVRHRRHIRSFSGPAAGRLFCRCYPSSSRAFRRAPPFTNPSCLPLFPIPFRNIGTCGSAHNQCRVKYHPFRLFLWIFQLF